MFYSGKVIVGMAFAGLIVGMGFFTYLTAQTFLERFKGGWNGY